MDEPTEAQREGFRPELGFWSVTGLIVGSIIGSGIFFTPALMLDYVGNAPLVMLAWVVGAVLSLCGALTFSELAAAYPKAGGQYVFIRESMGKLWGFLFSWTGFTVVQSGTIAAIAIAFANTLDYAVGHTLPGTESSLGFLTLPKWGVSFTAVAATWLLTYVNYRGVRHASAVNNLAGVLKVGALLFVVAVAFALGRSAGNYADMGADLGGVLTAGGLSAFGLALSESLFAYDGWAQATFVAPEVKDARRVLPRAITLGVLGVAAIYLLATAAYFYVLPASGIAPDTAMAQDTARVAWGAGAAGLVTAGILVSTFGATNSYVLSSPRIYYGVAQDREFPRAFGALSRHRTPTYGLVYQALWASLLALTGTFAQLTLLVVAGLWLFYLVSAVGYFRLLRRDPAAFAGYRMPLSPIPAIVFLVSAVAIMLNFAFEDPRTSLFTVGLVGSGLVAFALMRRGQAGEPAKRA